MGESGSGRACVSYSGQQNEIKVAIDRLSIMRCREKNHKLLNTDFDWLAKLTDTLIQRYYGADGRVNVTENHKSSYRADNV